MIEFKTLYLTEDEYKKFSTERKMWEASVVIVKGKDGVNREVKGRWKYPANSNMALIYLP